MNEISISLSLQHRHVASQYDVIHDSGDEKLYLVMELVQGGNLFEYLKSCEMITEEMACDIFFQLAEALQYMHEKRIVHRDLKPENILVDTSSPNHPQAKIADFGASKFFDDGYSVLQTKTGTKQYMAPEVQDRDEKSYTEQVDSWSLGVVLYVMLTDCYPFYDDLNLEEGGETMSQKIQQGKFKLNRCIKGSDQRISREAKDLIRNLIKPNPNERLSLEQCLSHSWTKKFAQNSTSFSRKDCAADCEESISLPTDVREVKQFRSDLSIFTIKSKFAATLRGKREVVVRWSREGPPPSAKAHEMARLELQRIFRKHFEGFSLQPRIQAR
jgi:serine/threonine protein kinase